MNKEIMRELSTEFLKRKDGKDKQEYRDSINFIKEDERFAINPVDKQWINNWKNLDCGKEISSIVKLRQVSLPKEGRLISEFAIDIIKEIKDSNEIFFRKGSNEIVEISNIKEEDNSFVGFINIKPNRFITLIEKYIEPGFWFLTSDKEWKFKKKSISGDLANTLLQSKILQDNLPKINRIFNFPIPIMYEGKLTFPCKGYDYRFNSYLDYSSPEIDSENITLEMAKEVIDSILKEFCFQDKQDYYNSISAMLTPFVRGLFSSFRVRVPLWVYIANRERAGKDYLADITGLIYEGYALEEPPICTGERNGNNNDELKKKILSAMISGRRRLHFANNKGFLDNSVLEAVTTTERYSDRVLGRNDILTMDNEMDYSLSGNIGIGFTPDIANRSKFIRLFLDIEDANSRQFENPNLHKWILDNRGLILSCFYRLIKNWIDLGSPKGKIPFASFYEWSEIIGGIMESAGYENPCNTDKETIMIGGDSETNDMKRLFEMCYEFFGEEWIDKNKIKNLIKGSDEELFSYINFENKSEQTKFGLKISKFIGRVLSGIRMTIDNPNARPSRQKIKFIKEVTQNSEKGGNVGNFR